MIYEFIQDDILFKNRIKCPVIFVKILRITTENIKLTNSYI